MNGTPAETAASAETPTDKTGDSSDEVRAHKLAEVRRRQQITQQDLAQALGVSQSRISQIERQSLDDTVLSTLAAYIEALGGRVRVVADFGDEQLVLSRVSAGILDVPPADAARRKRRGLTEGLKAKYEAGTSIRALANETNLSYGFVHRMLSESGVVLRGRNGGSRKKPSSEAARDRQ